MFEYDEFGNPIPLGTAVVRAQGGGTGVYQPLPPLQIPGGGPNTGGLATNYLPITGISAGNQNEFFQMPPLGQDTGLGGGVSYTGGFNTTGTGDFAPGLAGMQPFSPAPEADISLTSENPLFNVQPFGNAPEADIPLNFPAGPTSADFPMEFRSLEGIQEFDMPEEADIPLDFNFNADAAKSAGGGGGADSAKSGMGIQQAGMAASGVLGVAGGIADIVMGAKQMRDAQAQQKKQQNEIDKLKASQPSLSTPAEYYERVKNAYDTRLMQMRTEDINRNLANTTAAATSFGSRGLGALAGATSAANRAQRAEVLEQQQRQTAALGDLAGAQERSTQMKEARNVRETNFAQDQLMAAQALEQQSRQQMMGGIASTVGGGVQTALGFGAFGPLASVAGAALEEGGKVQKTPGKFSHEENEMAVITEEGDDTGIRVTGGEYVLNPDQAKSIKRLVESKDKEGLMKFMDDLLDEPQFA